MTSSIIGIDTTTKQRIEIPKPSRLRGLYIIGAPGTGKSGLIENLIIQDIEQDIGVCLLDPHGDLTYAVLARLPDRRVKDVILLDLLNTDYPFGLNLYQCSDPRNSTKVAYTRAQVMHIFTKLWGDENGKLGVWVEQYLRNSATTLIEKSYTMAELSLLFRNKNARSLLTAHLINPQAIEFWEEHNELKPDDQQQRYNTNLNRADAFLSEPIIYNIVGQQKTTINFRTVMDERKILLVKLDARLEEMTNLIGALIIAQFLNAAYSRAELPLEKRKQFNLYADEFQRFATEDFAILFTEARKFGMALTVAHQMREQLDRQNRSATLNVVNLVVFKVSSPDADELKGQFDTTPPPSETRSEYVRTPTHKPVDFIISGKSHTSEVVNTMLRQWKGVVETANESIHDIRIPAGTWRGRQEYNFVSNEPKIRRAQEGLQLMNDFLYQVMLEKNPFQRVKVYLCARVAIEFSLPFYRVSDGTGYLSVLLPEELGGIGDALSPEMVEAYTQLWLVPDEQLDQAFETFHVHVLEAMKVKYRLKLEKYFQWLYEKFEIFDEPFEILKLNRAAKSNPASQVVEPVRDKPYFNYWTNEQSGVTRPMKYPGVYWYHGFDLEKREEEFEVEKGIIPFEQLTYEKKGPYSSFYGNRLSSYLSSHEKELVGWTEEDNRLVIQGYYWRLKPGTLEEHLDVILEPVVEVELRGRESFIAFVRELRAVMQALATQPLEDISGVVEEKPGTTMTYADVANQIANELVKLDQYTARVKIALGVKSVEHIIQTFDPKKESRLGDTALKTRITAIQEQNIQDGYTRSRHEVEEENRVRHARLRQPQEQLFLPSSPDEPPGSPRRKKIT